MSLAGLALDLLLMVLLLAALAYGVRLERKLKSLREGQGAFAASVAALDAAAGRAEAALAGLRASADEAQDGLHDRIKAARLLKTELETLIARAERLGPTSAAAPPRAEEEEALELVVRAARAEAAAPVRPAAGRLLGPRRPRAAEDDLFETGASR